MKTMSIKLTMAALAALVSAPVFAADEVQLVTAIPGHLCGHISCPVGLSFTIKTKQLSANESVWVHYTYDGKTWHDSKADPSVKGMGSNGWRDAVVFDYPQDSSKARFAIKFKSNGKTYWDNNNGKNYKFDDVYGARINIFTFGGIYPSYQSCENKKIKIIDGSLYVRHLGNPKKVGIKYSLDNWATSHTTEAKYNYPEPGSPDGIENWTFTTPTFSPKKNQMQYAIYYTVNGKTYWDNNYGLNYKTSCDDYDLNWKYRY